MQYISLIIFRIKTNEDIAKKIFENGLEARSNDLNETAIPLINSNLPLEEQKTAIFTQIWPHRNHRCVVIIQIPIEIKTPQPIKTRLATTGAKIKKALS